MESAETEKKGRGKKRQTKVNDISATLSTLGITELRPLQSRANELLAEGKDIVIIGTSQSGKTLAYGVRLAETNGHTDGAILVVVPSAAHAERTKKALTSLGLSVRHVVEGAPKTASSGDILLGVTHEAVEALGTLPELASLSLLILDELADPLLPGAVAELDTLLRTAREKNKDLQCVLTVRSLNFNSSGLVNRHFRDPVQVTASVEASPERAVKHQYLEVGSDLLAKPNALAELLLAEDTISAAVFCNSPSDADFVDTMLRKRGIGVRKLIGNPPAFKVASAVKDLDEKRARVLVLTDVAAKAVSPEKCDIVINYSMPEDPDTYLQRLGNNGSGGKLGRAVSIIGPLDMTNFLYLKKFIKGEFTTVALPGPEEVAQKQFEKLIADATAATTAISTRAKSLGEQILKGKDREAVVAYLVHQVLDVLPQALSAAQASTERPMSEEGEGDGGERRGGGRWGRDEEGGHQGGRRDRRGDRRGDRRRFDDQGGSENGGGRERGEHESRPRREFVPAKKQIRFYVTDSSNRAKDASSLTSLLSTVSEATPDTFRHVSLRKGYGFFDVAEEQATAIEEAIRGKNDANLSIVRATVVPEPRPPQSVGNDSPSSEGVELAQAAEQ